MKPKVQSSLRANHKIKYIKRAKLFRKVSCYFFVCFYCVRMREISPYTHTARPAYCANTGKISRRAVSKPFAIIYAKKHMREMWSFYTRKNMYMYTMVQHKRNWNAMSDLQTFLWRIRNNLFGLMCVCVKGVFFFHLKNNIATRAGIICMGICAAKNLFHLREISEFVYCL